MTLTTACLEVLEVPVRGPRKVYLWLFMSPYLIRQLIPNLGAAPRALWARLAQNQGGNKLSTPRTTLENVSFGEMAGWLRTLLEDVGETPSTHMAVYYHL